MIVENKKATLEKASDISNLLLNVMKEESKTFNDADDPAEQFYLLNHIIGSFIAKCIISLDGYAKIYGIENLTSIDFYEWIILTTTEYIKAFKETGETNAGKNKNE
jgi:hypothetical protein